MMDPKINRLIEETMGSLDNIERASPKPYLLTRINAGLSQKTSSVWDKITAYLSKPVFVAGVLAIVIALNLFVMMNQSETVVTNEPVVTAGFATSSAALFDPVNIQP